MSGLYAQQIESARKSGVYEPYRTQVQRLLDNGHTRKEVSRIMNMSVGRLAVIIAVLKLHVGSGRRESPERRAARAAAIAAAAVRQELMVQRNIELRLVRCIYEAYGPVGKGFSVA